MRTAIALTLLGSGLLIRVCLNLHHWLVEPSHEREVVVAQSFEAQDPSKAKDADRQPGHTPTRTAGGTLEDFSGPEAKMTVYAEAKFSERCMQGNTGTCHQDLNEKKKWCEEGNLIDCTTLGWMLLQGAPGLKANVPQALALLENACTRGARGACASLGKIYQEGRGGVGKDDAKAIEFLKKNCTSTNATSCYELALLFYEGKGSLADKNNVVPLMLQSCDDNHLSACKWLADNNVVEASTATAVLALPPRPGN